MTDKIKDVCQRVFGADAGVKVEQLEGVMTVYVIPIKKLTV